MASRLNAVRLQRERALAARRPNKWLTEPIPDSERTEYAEWVMAQIDHWSPRWRALANFYGYERVNVLRKSGVDPSIAWGQLEAIRGRRQAELLNTDYYFRKRIVI